MTNHPSNKTRSGGVQIMSVSYNTAATACRRNSLNHSNVLARLFLSKLLNLGAESSAGWQCLIQIWIMHDGEYIASIEWYIKIGIVRCTWHTHLHLTLRVIVHTPMVGLKHQEHRHKYMARSDNSNSVSLFVWFVFKLWLI